MAHKIARIEAKRLYIEDGRSVEQIASLLPGVSEKSIYRWKSEEDWDKQREEISLTSVSTMKQTLLLLSKKLQEMVVSGQIDAKVADSIVKLSKVAERLNKDVNAYGNILLMVDELTAFLAERNSELLQQLHPYLLEFGTEMSRKFAKR